MTLYLLLSLTNTHSAKQKERAEKRDGKEVSNVSKEYSRGFSRKASRKPLDVMASKKLAESPKTRLTSSPTDPEPLKERKTGGSGHK